MAEIFRKAIAQREAAHSKVTELVASVGQARAQVEQYMRGVERKQAVQDEETKLLSVGLPPLLEALHKQLLGQYHTVSLSARAMRHRVHDSAAALADERPTCERASTSKPGERTRPALELWAVARD